MSKIKKTSILCSLILLSSQMLIPSVISAATLSQNKTVTKSVTQTAETPSVVNTSSNIASGTCGTVPWKIDSEGTLTLEGGTLAAHPSGCKASPWDTYSDKVKKIVFTAPVIANADSSYLFSYLTVLKTIEGLNLLDTKNVVDMSFMFSGSNNLDNLDLSNFNTSKVAAIDGMFMSCEGLINLNLTSFNTSLVTSMRQTFYNCKSLESLNLSSFDTTNVSTMNSMFAGCDKLPSLNLSSFNTKNLTDMYMMFYHCVNLFNLDLSNFDTSKVTNMYVTFGSCTHLTELNLSNFDTSKVTDMKGMLNQCKKISNISLGEKTLLNDTTNFLDGSWVNKNRTWAGNSKELIMRTKTGTEDNYFKIGQPVTINYIDDAGNELHEPQTMSGVIGGGYDASTNKYKLSINGYVLASSQLPINVKGVYTDTPQTVTYVYKATPESKAVTVNYVDESGKTIHDSQVIKGNVGDSYDASSDKYKLSIVGYSLDTSKLPKNATGSFTDQAQAVTYVYKDKSIPTPVKSLPVYRLYNPNTGEHFYTISSYEYNSVAKAGWRKEGVHWNAPEKGQAVYRLYNPNTGEHFFTLSPYEYNSVAKAGWRKEGIAFYSDNSKGAPVYRAFNPNSTGPGSHFYTDSSYEYNSVAKAGWRKEGIAFYGMK